MSVELSLLAAAGQAIAQAMATSGWESLKTRIARAFGRDSKRGDDVARELEQFRIELRERQLTEHQLAVEWQHWLQGRLARESNQVVQAVLEAARSPINIVGDGNRVDVGSGPRMGDVTVHMSPADLSGLLGGVSAAEGAGVLARLPAKRAADAIADLNDPRRSAAVLKTMAVSRAAAVLAKLNPGAAAAILEVMLAEAPRASAAILAALRPRTATKVTREIQPDKLAEMFGHMDSRPRAALLLQRTDAVRRVRVEERLPPDLRRDLATRVAAKRRSLLIRLTTAGVVVVLLLVVGFLVIPDLLITTVVGAVGTEKTAFFEDPRVQQAFKKHGFRVQVDGFGSRAIVQQKLNDYDFAFPGSSPTGQEIADKFYSDYHERPKGLEYPVSSPLVIATFKPIVALLEAKNLVTSEPDGSLQFDIGAYFDLWKGGLRWNDFTANNVHNNNLKVLIQTTDLVTSNSSAMFAALLSDVRNPAGRGPVTDSTTVQAQAQGEVGQYFLDEGASLPSSKYLFDEYVGSDGIDKAPMIVCYEWQFLSRQRQPNGQITGDMVMLYTNPTIDSPQPVISFTDMGAKVSQLLNADPEFRGLEAEYGMRTTADPSYFTNAVKKYGSQVPDHLPPTLNPPVYGIWNTLLDEIGQKLGG